MKIVKTLEDGSEEDSTSILKNVLKQLERRPTQSMS
jgi:hypothetical protein